MVKRERAGKMRKDIMNIGVVTFEPNWGNKEKNLERIVGYTEAAAKRGVDLILFPETALTGYDADAGNAGTEQMHCRLAEPIGGPSAQAVAEVAMARNVYVVYGFTELAEDGTVYNAAAVIGPQGIVGSYQKMHLPFTENAWAKRGCTPFMFDTDWGKVGLSICYDTFVFDELMRYYRACGCRLHLNPCAVDTMVTANNIKDAVEYKAANNAIFIASANLTGHHHSNDFVGGSNVIGPGKNVPAVHYYVGSAFGTPGTDEQELHIGTIDLSYVDKPFLAQQWADENPDFRPDVYAKMYQELAAMRPYSKET